MRRQLKPFVTEYRGGLRRGKDAAIAAEPTTEPLRSRVFDEAQRVFQPDTGEDSYEAALRAADALFARAAHQAPAAPTHAKTEASADPDETPVWPARDDKQSTARHTDAPLAGDAAETAPPRRILQAIEPPEENRFAALEAERAPKRRGRKPGSKNKPKVVIGDDWPAATPVQAAKMRAPSSAALGNGARHGFAFDPALDDEIVDDEILDDEIVDEEIVDEAGPAVPSPDGGELPIGDDPSAESQPRGRNDKFTRKRAGLRPGERWKRRLPKAAW